ncbi:MAG: ribokinase [Bryobacteraceae bacterium]|nr:ribokinase [Bryobacteraceae bacterium]MCO5351422.1 ribokinase [Bryobacteraceae bacterium]
MSTSSGSIVVTGSLNMDFVVTVPHLPAPGETTLGSDFQRIPGGKGANQACAAARLASAPCVRMLGRVGYDPSADELKNSLADAGVDVALVRATRSAPTGVALIWVEQGTGRNSIVVAPGANHALSASDIDEALSIFEDARCALFQLETPLPTVERALIAARQRGARTILDPAPAQPLPPRLLAEVDLLTPNESEACQLLGRPPAEITRAEAPALAAALRELGPRAVVLKLGAQGSFFSSKDREIFSPAFAVQPVDTTAAGDVFNGALAVALAEGQAIEQALAFANAAAALSVTRPGAQPAIPHRAEVDALLHQGRRITA